MRAPLENSNGMRAQPASQRCAKMEKLAGIGPICGVRIYGKLGRENVRWRTGGSGNAVKPSGYFVSEGKVRWRDGEVGKRDGATGLLVGSETAGRWWRGRDRNMTNARQQRGAGSLRTDIDRSSRSIPTTRSIPGVFLFEFALTLRGRGRDPSDTIAPLGIVWKSCIGVVTVVPGQEKDWGSPIIFAALCPYHFGLCQFCIYCCFCPSIFSTIIEDYVPITPSCWLRHASVPVSSNSKHFLFIIARGAAAPSETWVDFANWVIVFRSWFCTMETLTRFLGWSSGFCGVWSRPWVVTRDAVELCLEDEWDYRGLAECHVCCVTARAVGSVRSGECLFWMFELSDNLILIVFMWNCLLILYSIGKCY